MKTKHAEKRAQQRGIEAGIETLLQTFGDKRPAPHGCLIRFFSKKSIERIETLFGHDFVARNHEKLKSYLAKRTQHRHGIHKYSLDKYGLDEAELMQNFQRESDLANG